MEGRVPELGLGLNVGAALGQQRLDSCVIATICGAMERRFPCRVLGVGASAVVQEHLDHVWRIPRSVMKRRVAALGRGTNVSALAQQHLGSFDVPTLYGAMQCRFPVQCRKVHVSALVQKHLDDGWVPGASSVVKRRVALERLEVDVGALLHEHLHYELIPLLCREVERRDSGPGCLVDVGVFREKQERLLLSLTSRDCSPKCRVEERHQIRQATGTREKWDPLGGKYPSLSCKPRRILVQSSVVQSYLGI
mmetsp:Transcript_43162/g.102707  ORF Transcript_43162/g.102707 Transcript_43162/m.102707 type:complete len:251 (+) Transcript_43162:339-1091(+)